MAEHETVRGAVTGGGLARTAQVPPSASRRPAQDDAGRSSSESSSESKRSNTSATAFGQGVLRRDATDLLHHRLHRRAPDHQNARLVRSRAGEGVGSPAWHEHEGAGVNTVAACIAQHELHLEHGSGRPAPRRLPQPATPVRTRSRGGRVATRLALLQPLPISTPLGWRGWRVQPRCRWWEFPLAEGTCAGPTGEQYLQLAHDRKRGQADARAFGSSRSSVTKAWATDTKLT